jgi:anti-anti-sigma factor
MTADGIDVQGDRAVATIDGDLTAATAPRWRDSLVQLTKQDIRHLVIDLSTASIVDSSGIGLLLAAHNSIQRRGGQMEVIGASEDLVVLFRTMRLDKHFPVAGR